MSRVEDLEARVAELAAELDGLLDEYMDTRRRLHELEASHGSGTTRPDPYGLGDDPHAAVIDRSRTESDAGQGGAAGGTSARSDGTPPVGSTRDGTDQEASQEEVDEAVRRVEGDADGDDGERDGDTPLGDADDPQGAPEHHADDIIVG